MGLLYGLRGDSSNVHTWSSNPSLSRAQARPLGGHGGQRLLVYCTDVRSGARCAQGCARGTGKGMSNSQLLLAAPASPPPPLEAGLGGGISSSDVFGVLLGLADELVAGDQRQGGQGGQGLFLGSSPSGSPDGTCPSVEGHIPGWRSSPDASLWVL